MMMMVMVIMVMVIVMVIMVHNADGEFVPVNLVHAASKSSSPFGISKTAPLLKFRNCLSLPHSVLCCLLDNNRKYGTVPKIRVALIISM